MRALYSWRVLVITLVLVCGAPAGRAQSDAPPNGVTQSFRATVEYLLALEQSGSPWPAGIARPLIVMKVGPIVVLPAQPMEELYYTPGVWGNLPVPEFAGLAPAADAALFPAAPNGAEIVFTAYSTAMNLNIGFLNTFDFIADTGLTVPTWWDHPASVPGIWGQFSPIMHIDSPVFENTPSAEQGNLTPDLASRASGRGGLLQLRFTHMRTNAAASPAAGVLMIPQHALAFVADGHRYVVEFVNSDGFVWGAADAFSDPVPVRTRQGTNYGYFSHTVIALAVLAGRSMTIDDVSYDVVHLYGRNPNENLLTCLSDPQRRL